MKIQTKVKYIWPTTNFFDQNETYNLIWLFDQPKPIEVSCNKIKINKDISQTKIRIEMNEFIKYFVAI